MRERQCSLLSLDIWDTVVRRKCCPDEIKVRTAQRLLDCCGNPFLRKMSARKLAKLRIRCEYEIGKDNRHNGYDDEYELYEVLKRWCKKVFPVARRKADSIAKMLYNYEISEELDSCYLDAGIEELIETISYQRLILVSDFYIGHDFIQNILKKSGFSKKVDEIYISCESKYNKRSGRLYDYVFEHEKVAQTDWIHIGDNIYSDVEVAKGKGIHAIHYWPEEESEWRMKKEQDFQWTDPEEIKLAANHDISGFFFGFIYWLIEETKKSGIQKLYFFTREGEFFKRLYDCMRDNLLLQKELPETEILEVSRLSTFLPSIREISLEEFMRIWNQYSTQSMRAFFQSLNIKASKVDRYVEQYGLSWEEPIQYPWEDARVQKLFRNREFVSLIEKAAERRRYTLLEYLADHGLEKGREEHIGIVDIGWRGSIQDNLCYLFSEKKIDGYYIALLPFLSSQPLNSQKKGYLNGYRLFDMILRSVTPFEMICNSPNGSTIGYKMSKKGARAIRKCERSEDAVFYSYTAKEQERIFKQIDDYSKTVRSTGFDEKQYRTQAYDTLYHFIAWPRRTVVKAYFSLRHNEMFGVGSFVDKRTKLRIGLMMEAVFSKRKRRELIEFLDHTTWAQGYMVKYHLYPLLWIWNWALKARVGH